MIRCLKGPNIVCTRSGTAPRLRSRRHGRRRPVTTCGGTRRHADPVDHRHPGYSQHRAPVAAATSCPARAGRTWAVSDIGANRHPRRCRLGIEPVLLPTRQLTVTTTWLRRFRRQLDTATGPAYQRSSPAHRRARGGRLRRDRCRGADSQHVQHQRYSYRNYAGYRGGSRTHCRAVRADCAPDISGPDRGACAERYRHHIRRSCRPAGGARCSSVSPMCCSPRWLRQSWQCWRFA